MHSINKKSYGFLVSIEGRFDKAEAVHLWDEVRAALSGNTEEFSTIFDIRKLVPPQPECQSLLRETVDFAIKSGMNRVAVIYKSPVVREWLRQLAFLSGREPIGRYIDAAKFEDPDQVARDYVENGVEPPSMTQQIRVTAG